jgi:hypothetical protein
MRSQEEIKQLAIDVVEGKVFGSWMIPPKDLALLERIFMPLALTPTDALPKDISVVYEYRDKVAPLGINGYPVFFSFHYLNGEERELLTQEMNLYQKLKQQFLAKPDTSL